MRPTLSTLAARLDIAPGYHDLQGEYHAASEDTLQSLIAAMGLACGSEAEERQSLTLLDALDARLPPCIVRAAGSPREIALPASLPERWTISLEQGDTLPATALAQRLILPALPAGYHRLASDDGTVQTRLIIAPPQCYQPPFAAQGGKTWGVSAQLYSVRTRSDWGMGDFTGLRKLIDWTARHGGGAVGINPLHALPLTDPAAASPYSPVSREFFNPLYLDVPAIEDFAECRPAREEFASTHFQTRLRWLRQQELTHYPDIAALKWPLLQRLYQHFRAAHLDQADRRGQAFRAFQSQGGETLFRYTLYCALQAHFHHLDASASGWRDWPLAYQDFHHAAVAAFAREHSSEVEFYQYLQWQCEIQLSSVGKLAWDRQMKIGLYGDLAVGAHPSGADTWIEPACFARGASIGAPPDAFAPQGQDWGLPPWIPQQLKAAGYAPFIRMLRANMRFTGALRIDHIMGLYRLFWVPAGMTAADGAYVHYAHEDLFAILALESQRNACLIVGEDLGTVPDEVRALMSRFGLFSTRLMMFEKHWDGAFKPPRAYPAAAVASFGSHDTPTLNGYWNGRDLEWRHGAEINTFDHVLSQRMLEKQRLLEALSAHDCHPPLEAETPSAELAASVHAYLAKTPAALVLASAEDLMDMHEAPNIPGTIDEHPNWQRRLSLDLEDWNWSERIRAILGAFHANGR